MNISNGKKCSHQSPNPIFSWKSAFLTVVVKNVQTVLMAQHSRKDCGHLRNFLLKHVFCLVFAFSQWWRALQASHLECLPKNWNVFRRKRNEEITSEGAKDNERMSQRINQVCNASHFQKLWFCPFPGIWHHFRATLRMCPTCSFCADSFKFPCSSTFQWADFGLKSQILAWTNDAKLVFERNCHQSRIGRFCCQD